MKILAVKLREIGDTVIWTSALQALREEIPGAEIHVLTYAGNASVLENHPAVDHCWFLRSHSRWEMLKLLWRLRAEKFAWLLGFNANTSLCRWAWLAGAGQMALHHFSWTHTPRGSVPMPHAGELEDAILRDYRVLEAMGLQTARRPTQIHLTEKEIAAAEERLRAAIAAAGGDNSKPRYLFLPGARHPLHRYPKDLWLSLASELRKANRYQPVVVVDPALSREWNLREECASFGLPLIDNAKLREFISVIGRAERAFANDSAPAHIAVALGVRTGMVFGPGCPGDWHPYDRERHPLFYADVPCRARGPRDRAQFQFCTVEQCSHHRCMRELKIDLNF